MPVNKQYKSSICGMTRFRELGLKRSVWDMDGMCKNMYSAMGTDISKHCNNCTERGGVFDLEFSKDGKLLVAACQDNALLIYDSFNQRSIARLFDAHGKSVTCIKYINHHTFASGSDDGLVKLWDSRNLSRCKQKFSGHSYLVKSIDYSEHDNMLISSSVDGSVMGWNINSPIADSSSKLFAMNGLLRTKLSPDSTKMAVATTSGFIVLVHDLIIEELKGDFNAFRPNVYSLLQGDQIFPAATMYNHLFSQEKKRNRLEFISDFPKQIETINSIQIHPRGWCALSRSISRSNEEVFTTVHDIQTRDNKDYARAFKYVQEEAVPKCPEPTSKTIQSDTWTAGCLRNQGYDPEINPFHKSADNEDFMSSDNLSMNSGLYSTSNGQHIWKTSKSKKIITNLPRMTHFIEELNVDRMLIKEPCFSADGRIMCSPYGKGVRLFSFNKEVQELNLCVPKRPKKLHTLNVMRNFHDDKVVCCQFNPINNYQLVTGCLGERIVWYAPDF